MVGEPVAIGEAGGGLLLHLPIAQQTTLLEIHRQHLARTEPTLFNDAALLQFDHARFRTHHHVAVAGDAVAGRPQAIAIERGTHHATVAEHQQRRPIPGLLQTGVVLIEGLNGRALLQLGLVAEGLGHQGEQAVGDRPATAHHQLEGGIEVGGITEGGIDERPQIGGSISPDRLEVGFSGTGPVDVAQQRVDLAVVAQQPHRLGQGPAGQGVGAEAPVVDGEVDREALIAQVGVIAIQHLGAHHALVDDGAGTDRGEVEVGGAVPPDLAHPINGTPAQAEQHGLDRIDLHRHAGRSIGRLQQPLLDHRGGLPGEGTEHGRIHRHRPPAETVQPESGRLLFTDGASLLTALRIHRHEHHAQTAHLAATGCRLGPDRLEKSPGNGAENAGPIAGVAITTTAAAMFHAAQTAQGLGQHPVVRLAAEMGKEAHPTGVLLADHRRRRRAVAVRPDGRDGVGHGPGHERRTKGGR